MPLNKKGVAPLSNYLLSWFKIRIMRKILFVLCLGLVGFGYGQDSKTIKIDYEIEVMTKDLGEMNWYKAKEACVALGDGWRLPTKKELDIIFDEDDFEDYYWTSTEEGDVYAWFQDFYNGSQTAVEKSAENYVLPVRTKQ